MKTQARRCTCWGILYYSTEDESFFQGCGTVTELDCMIFRESGKFTGIAVVSFKMEAATKRALRSVALTEEIKVGHEAHVMRFLLEFSAVVGIENYVFLWKE
ncbi:phragmoplastin interacting protein 1-like isoform X2 [Wolffia australiana]